MMMSSEFGSRGANVTTFDGRPPVVCTLTIAQLATRALEWADLGPLTIAKQPIENGAAVTLPLELLGSLTDLVEREHDCCGSWLRATITALPDSLVLRITTTNPDGVPVIRKMSGLDD